MASFNKVILIGNMTADPELKQTVSGTSVSSFSIAANRKFGKENEKDCDFINIVAWRQSAEFVCRYFKKGQPILVCGQLQTRSWTDNQGQKRYVTEVVADEISFVASANQGPTTAQTQGGIASTENGTNHGIVGAYIPDAYKTGAQFEEIPNDGDLPF